MTTRRGRRGFGSVRRLPSGRYQARWTHPTTGETHSGTSTFRNKTDASSYLAQVETDLHRGAWSDPRGGRTPFDQWAQQYLDTAVQKRPSTKRTFRYILDNHLVPAFGSRPIGGITTVDARRFVSQATEGGATRETVRTRYAVLREIMNGAVDQGLIAASPCRNVQLPPREPDRVRLLEPEQLEELASAIDPDYEAMIWLAGVVGLRWSEVAGLRVGRLDLLHDHLTVAETIGHDGGVSDVKTRSSKRTLSVPPLVRDKLAAHLARRKLSAANGNELLFVPPRGAALDYSNWHRRKWAPAVKAAGLDGLHFHHLRHTAVALMVRAGTHARVIQEHVGHSSFVTTMDIYAHLFPAADDEVSRGLQDLFRPATGTPMARGGREGDH